MSASLRDGRMPVKFGYAPKATELLRCRELAVLGKSGQCFKFRLSGKFV